MAEKKRPGYGPGSHKLIGKYYIELTSIWFGVSEQQLDGFHIRSLLD
jgi:hypothetical protein